MTPQNPPGGRTDLKRQRPAIDPLIDCVFKKIFGSEEHKGLLVHFLNALMGPRAGMIVAEVELLNPYNQRDLPDDKLTEVDVKARDDEGRIYQIEVQLILGEHITRRMVYTWSSVMAKEIEKGDQFFQVRPVIGIWLFKRNLFPGGCPVHFFQWHDRNEGVLLTEEDYLIAIELDKWSGLLNRGGRGKMGVCQTEGGDGNKGNKGDNGNNGLSEIERWVWMLTHGKEIDLDNPPVECRTPEMLEVVEVLKSFTQEDREWDLYERRMIAQSERATWKGYIEAAREELKKAQKKLREEAREKERYRKAAEQAENAAKQAEKAAKQAEKATEQAEKAVEEERGARDKVIQVIEEERLEREETMRKAVLALSGRGLGPEDIAASLGLKLKEVQAMLDRLDA